MKMFSKCSVQKKSSQSAGCVHLKMSGLTIFKKQKGEKKSKTNQANMTPAVVNL